MLAALCSLLLAVACYCMPLSNVRANPTPVINSTVLSPSTEDTQATLWVTPDFAGPASGFEITVIHITGLMSGSFSSLPSTRSSYVSPAFTLSSASEFTAGSGLHVSLTPARHCDTDFTLVLRISAINNTELVLSTTTSVATSVVAVADEPGISLPPVANATEDMQFSMLSTPQLFQDTDSSEFLNSYVVSGLPLGSSFSALASTTSVVALGTYTISLSGSGFSSGTPLVHFSLSSCVQSDLDFTLTAAIYAIEQNGGSAAASTSKTLGVFVGATSDTPAAGMVPALVTSEDTAARITLSPVLVDTDGSELWTFVVSRVEVGTSFSSLYGTTSDLNFPAALYTLVSPSVGAPEGSITGLSLSPTANCDVDFTVGTVFWALETNGGALDPTVSINSTMTTVVKGVAETSQVVVVNVTTREDVIPTLSVTPLLDDTDSSERLPVFTARGVPSGVAFQKISGQKSCSLVGDAYTVTMGNGFTPNQKLSGFQFKAIPYQCDIDFSLTLRTNSLERNGRDVGVGATTLLTCFLSADVDIPAIVVVSETVTSEDIAVVLSVLPALYQDTDLSEVLQSVSLSASPAGASFSGVNSTRSDVDGSMYTLQVTSMSGFESYAHINGLSVSSPVQCDRDFTITCTTTGIEKNGADTIRAGTVSLAVKISSVVDTPSLTLSPFTNSAEDANVFISLTPSAGLDTDGSQRLLTLGVFTHVNESISLHATDAVVSNVEGLFTLSSLDSDGFISESLIPGYSVSPPLQSDLDFTLSILATVSETNNGQAMCTTTRSVGISVYAHCDGSSIRGDPSSATSEDMMMAYSISPTLGLDTDLSEQVTRLTIDHLRPGVTFRALSSTSSAQTDTTYTLLPMAMSGFSFSERLQGFSISPTVDSDADFTIQALAFTLEINGRDSLTTEVLSLNTSLLAVCDEPSFEIDNNIVAVEDEVLFLPTTPLLFVDTDGSEYFNSLVLRFNSTALPVQFSSLPSTTSLLFSGQFTLSAQSRNVFQSSSVVSSLSMHPTLNCDWDFHLEAQFYASEANGESSLRSGTLSVSTVLSAVADIPFVDVVPTTIASEDVSFVMALTPQPSDSDGSEVFIAFLIHATPVGISFREIPNTISAVIDQSYTFTAITNGFEPWVQHTLSVQPPIDCSVDFTVSFSMSVHESNGLDTIFSAPVSVGTQVFPVVDVPFVTTTPSTATTENIPVLFEITPYTGTTDESEFVSKIRLSGPHMLFSALSSTYSTTSGLVYTLSSANEAGFFSATKLQGLSVSHGSECDVDFTLSVWSGAKERNNVVDEVFSPSTGVGIAITSVTDESAIVTGLIGGIEDAAIRVLVTPTFGTDTDHSERQKSLRLFNEGDRNWYMQQVYQGSRFCGDDFCLYTAAGTGFRVDKTVEGLYLSGAVNCDIDFSLSASLYSAEDNGVDGIVTTSTSIGVAIAARADVPLSSLTLSNTTLEDSSSAVFVTPNASADTDGSEVLTEVVIGNIPTGTRFTDVPGASSTLSQTGGVYSVRPLAGTGFAEGVQLPSLSFTSATHCDSDFTLYAVTTTLEQNGESTYKSTRTYTGIVVGSVVDPLNVVAAATYAATEDSSVPVEVTPFPTDTDLSERLRRAAVVGFPDGIQFKAATRDVNETNLVSSLFTLTAASGTGFATARTIGLSLSHTAQSDIDFTIGWIVYITEENGLGTTDATVSAALQFSANADQPSIATTDTLTSEDAVVAMALTPVSSVDTDFSEVLPLVTVQQVSFPLSISFSSLVQTVSKVSGQTYTLTSLQFSGFATERISSFSVSPATMCDSDFSLLARVLSSEYNGVSIEWSSAVQSVISVSPVADIPRLTVSDGTTTEDFSLALAVTVAFGDDTDRSERLSLLRIRSNIPHLHMGSVPATQSALLNSVYTMTAPTSGFQAFAQLLSLSVSPTFQCDSDFTLTVALTSREDLSVARSDDVHLGVRIIAESDQPTLSSVPSLQASEDVVVRVPMTPSLGLDSDGSEQLLSIVWGGWSIVTVAVGESEVDVSPDSNGEYALGFEHLSSDVNSTLGLSMLLIDGCDADFTLSFRAISSESNSMVESTSSTTSVGVSIEAVCDTPEIMLSSQSAIEQSSTGIHATPLSTDTDLSETLDKLMIKSVPSGVSFSPITKTMSQLSSGVYTISVLFGTVFGWNSRLATSGLSMTPPDVWDDSDFFLTMSLRVSEANGVDFQISQGFELHVTVTNVEIDECYEGIHDCDGQHGVCSNVFGSFSCSCSEGYSHNTTGDTTVCDDVHECEDGSHNCNTLASCVNTAGSFSCMCSENMWGDGVECTWCGQNATSPAGSVSAGSCNCVSGYSGDASVMCSDDDECSFGSHDCSEHANCTNSLGSFECTCAEGYWGDGLLCTPCAVHASSEVASTHSSNCTCYAGYYGEGSVECFDFDECSLGTHACDVNAVCLNTPGSFECGCLQGLWGNGVTCTMCAANATAPAWSYSADNCSCNAGYDGIGSMTCQDRDECGLGTHDCLDSVPCWNTAGSFVCGCGQGLWGDGINCIQCNANATSAPGSTDPSNCTCLFGYSGDGHTICTDIDECLDGTHTCDVNATCTNSVGGFECECVKDFFGDGESCEQCPDHSSASAGSTQVGNCTCIPGYIKDESVCVDNDECSHGLHDCHSDLALCTNTDGSFTCGCFADYWGTGVTCEACGAHASSPVGSASSSSCVCNIGYEGDGAFGCDDVNECVLSAHQCSDSASCVNTDSSFMCVCLDGYISDGLDCDDVNECEADGDVCGLTAGCLNLVGGYGCFALLAEGDFSAQYGEDDVISIPLVPITWVEGQGTLSVFEMSLATSSDMKEFIIGDASSIDSVSSGSNALHLSTSSFLNDTNVGVSLQPENYCDVDFTLSITLSAIDDENGTIASVSYAYGISLEAIANGPSISMLLSDDVLLEDSYLVLTATPKSSDSDGSEVVSTLAITSVSDVYYQYAHIIDIDGDNASGGDGSGSGSGSGSDVSVWSVHSMSLTASTDCDQDFTLTASAMLIESNGGDTSSYVRTRGLEVWGVADAPALEVASTSTELDTMVAIRATPTLSDTDGSELLHLLASCSGQVLFRGGLNETIVEGGLPYSSEIFASTDSGFTSGAIIGSLSVSPPVNEDVDFYLTLSAVAMESNGEDSTAVSEAAHALIDVAYTGGLWVDIVGPDSIDLTQQLQLTAYLYGPSCGPCPEGQYNWTARVTSDDMDVLPEGIENSLVSASAENSATVNVPSTSVDREVDIMFELVVCNTTSGACAWETKSVSYVYCVVGAEATSNGEEIFTFEEFTIVIDPIHTCAGLKKDTVFDYSWSTLQPSVLDISGQASGRLVVVPPNTLAVGQSATLVGLVCLRGTANCYSDELTFSVVRSSVVAALSGGSGAHNILNDLALDASGSYDPDGLALEYVWDCTTTSGNVCPGFFLLSEEESSLLVVPSSYLFEGSFTYRVSVLAEDGQTNATAFETIDVVQLSDPSATVEIASAPISPFAANDKVVIIASVGDSLVDADVYWSVTPGTSADTSQVHYVDLDSPSVLTSRNDLVLSLAPNTLRPGFTYNFRVDVFTAETALWRFVSIQPAPAINVGIADVFPRNGFGLSTIFRVETSGWDDPLNAGSLQYRFFIRVAGIEYHLSDWQGIGTIETTLPGGDSEEDLLVHLLVSCRTSYGAVSTLSIAHIYVEWRLDAIALTGSYAEALIQQSWKNAATAGSLDPITNSITQMAMLLNEYEETSLDLPSLQASRLHLLKELQNLTDVHKEAKGYVQDTDRYASIMAALLKRENQLSATSISLSVDLLSWFVADGFGTDSSLSIAGASNLLSALGNALSKASLTSDVLFEVGPNIIDTAGQVGLRLASDALEGEVTQCAGNSMILVSSACRSGVVGGSGAYDPVSCVDTKTPFTFPLDSSSGSTSAVTLVLSEFAMNPYAGQEGNAHAVSTVSSLSIYDPGTVAEISASSLSHPVSFVAAVPSDEADGVHHVCAYWDEEGDDWSSEGCIGFPNPAPPGMVFEWDSDFDYADSDTLQFAWVPAVEGCLEYEALLAADGTWLRFFGHVGQRTCPMLEGISGCYWNGTVQAFEGAGCVFSSTMECRCNHLSSFSVVSTPVLSHNIVIPAADLSANDASSNVEILVMTIPIAAIVLMVAMHVWSSARFDKLCYKLLQDHAKVKGDILLWDIAIDKLPGGGCVVGPGVDLLACLDLDLELMLSALPRVQDSASTAWAEIEYRSCHFVSPHMKNTFSADIMGRDSFYLAPGSSRHPSRYIRLATASSLVACDEGGDGSLSGLGSLAGNGSALPTPNATGRSTASQISHNTQASRSTEPSSRDSSAWSAVQVVSGIPVDFERRVSFLRNDDTPSQPNPDASSRSVGQAAATPSPSTTCKNPVQKVPEWPVGLVQNARLGATTGMTAHDGIPGRSRGRSVDRPQTGRSKASLDTTTATARSEGPMECWVGGGSTLTSEEIGASIPQVPEDSTSNRGRFFVGTALVLAWLHVRRLSKSPSVEKFVRRAHTYFCAGDSRLGNDGVTLDFRLFVEQLKGMLLHVKDRGFARAAGAWKLTFLQANDGFWMLSDDLLSVLNPPISILRLLQDSAANPLEAAPEIDSSSESSEASSVGRMSPDSDHVDHLPAAVEKPISPTSDMPSASGAEARRELSAVHTDVRATSKLTPLDHDRGVQPPRSANNDHCSDGSSVDVGMLPPRIKLPGQKHVPTSVVRACLRLAPVSISGLPASTTATTSNTSKYSAGPRGSVTSSMVTGSTMETMSTMTAATTATTMTSMTTLTSATSARSTSSSSTLSESTATDYTSYTDRTGRSWTDSERTSRSSGSSFVTASHGSSGTVAHEVRKSSLATSDLGSRPVAGRRSIVNGRRGSKESSVVAFGDDLAGSENESYASYDDHFDYQGVGLLLTRCSPVWLLARLDGGVNGSALTAQPWLIRDAKTLRRAWATALAVVYLESCSEGVWVTEFHPAFETSSRRARAWLTSILGKASAARLVSEAAEILREWRRGREKEVTYQLSHFTLARRALGRFGARLLDLVRVALFLKVDDDVTSSPALIIVLTCCNIVAVMFLTILTYFVRSETCCDLLKEELCEDADRLTPCYEAEDDAPSCHRLYSTYQSSLECEEFPVLDNAMDRSAVIFAACAFALPFEFLASWMFRGFLQAHLPGRWVGAVGTMRYHLLRLSLSKWWPTRRSKVYSADAFRKNDLRDASHMRKNRHVIPWSRRTWGHVVVGVLGFYGLGMSALTLVMAALLRDNSNTEQFDEAMFMGYFAFLVGLWVRQLRVLLLEVLYGTVSLCKSIVRPDVVSLGDEILKKPPVEVVIGAGRL